LSSSSSLGKKATKRVRFGRDLFGGSRLMVTIAGTGEDEEEEEAVIRIDGVVGMMETSR
jgi:hypothetical protein